MAGKTTRAARWVINLSPGWRSILQSFFLAGSYVVAAIGEKIVQDIFEKNQWSAGLFPKLIITILVISLGLVCYLLINSLAQIAHQEETKQKNALSYAYSLIDQQTIKQIRQITHQLDEAGTQTIEGLLVSLALSDATLHDIVNCVYSVFESQYGRSEKAQNRVDFEVTYMSKSYIDQEITIPAYANRTGRKPISMNHREKDKQIYKKTITADLYEEVSPRMRIIPNTREPSTGYTELYVGQKDRIQSTLVFPVMCDKNRILGTLVVHCNEPYFFQEKDRQFWNELMEIFGKRVALEKIRLDAVSLRAAVSEGYLTIFGLRKQLPF